MDAEMHDVDMKQERINNEDQPGASQGDRLGGHVKEEDDGCVFRARHAGSLAPRGVVCLTPFAPLHQAS